MAFGPDPNAYRKMRRYVPVLIAGIALIAAACGDTVAPPASVSATDLKLFGTVEREVRVRPSGQTNVATATFVIPAAGGRVQVGEFSLRFPANSVCDPATSQYGPEYWLAPCTTLSTDFQITAKVFSGNGESHVEFSPDIRFHPDRWVTISVVRTEIIGQRLTPSLMRKYAIWMTRQQGEIRQYIDDTRGDPTLVTRFNTETGLVWRRIRHFTGVVIHTGTCTETPSDPSCMVTQQY